MLAELQKLKASKSANNLSKLDHLFRTYDPQAIDGDTPALVCELAKLASQTEFGTVRGQALATLEAIFDACESRAREFMLLPTPVLVHPASPDNYTQTADPSPELAPVVSLTCIRGRIDRLAATIETINRQELRPQSINLYISSEPYLLDKGISVDYDKLKVIHRMGVNVYVTPNIGPYRKQYFIISQLQRVRANPSTIVVTLDDDVLYPPDTLGKLVSVCRKEEAVTAQRGREMLVGGEGIARYKSFREAQSRKSHMNIANGRNGIAYQLRFFPKDHNLYIGPFLAPTADDLWCKWVTAYYCIPTIILEPKAAYDVRFDFAETSAFDKESLFHSYNARGNNDVAIGALEVYFQSRLIGLYTLHGGAR